ncbi:OHCU-decarbox domain-containing protein [Mycena kentingensis (nom. inval.)]|nr:OHCU-decarbox domain-containing protein [Mycena kentingensis (nom. inval.)]
MALPTRIDAQSVPELLKLLLEAPQSTLPDLVTSLEGRSDLTSYDDFIDAAIAQVNLWPSPQRAAFIEGHPRIGEQSSAISAASAKEQGAIPAALPTPPEVLARLAHLNACYERVYPNLRYITFVNGRSRAEIALEMEDFLGIPHSLSPDSPAVDTFVSIESDSTQWLAELDRAVQDVGRIAKSRALAAGRP